MDFDKYKMTRLYPSAQDYPLMPTNPTPDEHRKRADAMESHFQAIEVWKKARSEWQAEQSRLLEVFKADALAEVGLENHPKADKAYGMAWKNGHSGGYSEVYYCLLDYAELLKD